MLHFAPHRSRGGNVVPALGLANGENVPVTQLQVVVFVSTQSGGKLNRQILIGGIRSAPPVRSVSGRLPPGPRFSSDPRPRSPDPLHACLWSAG